MRIGNGELSYDWQDNWARIPETQWVKSNGRTHGVVATRNNDIMVFNQAKPGILRFDPNGKLLNAWGDRFLGAHGMTLVEEDGVEYLWLTDQGGEVVKTTLDGNTVMTIRRPDLTGYENGSIYCPTWVAVSEARFGGNGDIWVADGYGSHYVHRYDKSGAYLGSINGTEGKAGAFKCPHAVGVSFRKGEPELYVADRGNKRIQVYDAQAKYKRVFGEDFLHSPCMFAFEPGSKRLFIPELYGRVAVLDGNDHLIGYVASNDGVEKTKDWPNKTAEQLEPGKLNSPHGMTVDHLGNLYVVEWIVGGRITKMVKA